MRVELPNDAQSVVDDLTFAQRLDRFGAATAIVTDSGETLSYIELAARADAFARTLGHARRLLLIEATNALEPLIAYLGALRGGHPVILAAAGSDLERLRSAFQPDARYAATDGAWRLETVDGPPLGLHADLAVLLSTSGTTGATKLVRLSVAAIEANARSIVEYLGITASERAITTLPFHYSYGLSVVNSHLSAGATLLLTDKSVVDPEFWSFAEAQSATSLAGVPYTYDLIERAGGRDRAPPSLRTMTQAGGRLSPEMVSRFGTWAQDRGIRFFVMYGQTEATARMAYLPPEVTLTSPEAIGVPIPGGAFRLIDADGATIQAADAVGELVYRGPNVMMGYAVSASDLARGPELTELHTGDLAKRGADGLYRIVGRKSRFAKVYGLRISLDDVEARIERAGARGVAVSDDVAVFVAVTGDVDPSALSDTLAHEYKLPAATFQISRVDALPTLPSGKIDYQRVLRDGQARTKAPSGTSAGNAIEAAFAHAFPRVRVGPQDSFVSLGGDSLNYVTISLEVEGALGFLPEAWEQLSIRELGSLARRAGPKRWWSLRALETEVVLRMLAILAVVVNHASNFVVGGGAEVLLILAGYNLGRYQRARLAAGRGFDFALSFARRIILPYYLLLAGYLAAKHEFDLPSLLLVSNFFGRFGSLIEPFWFLEAMIQALLLVALLSLLKPVQRAIANDPWRFGLICLGAALVLKVGALAVFDHGRLVNRTPDAVLFLIALGWCVNEATTQFRRIIMTAVLAGLAVVEVVGLPGLWVSYPHPSNISHAVWLGLCAVALLWVRRVPLPALAHGVVGAIAAASFYIYLTHVIPLWVLYWRIGMKSLAVNLGASVALGLLVWWAAGQWSDWRAAKNARVEA